MSSKKIDENRKLIPRWKLFDISVETGEVENLTRSSCEKLDDEFYEEKLLEWRNEKNLVSASGLIGSGLINADIKNPLVQEAANFIILHSNEASSTNILSAKIVKDEIPKADISSALLLCKDPKLYQGHVRRLRLILKEYPNDPIVWMDLAFNHTALGNLKKARKCVLTAITLNKFNRFIVRGAARFFLHLDEYDFALRIVRQNPFLEIDPWLIASEVSISEAMNKKSVSVDQGFRLLSDRDFSAFHLSELAGSLGTLELSHGKRRNGKKLLNESLISPTENTLAQVQFLSDELNEEFPYQKSDVNNVFEAKARKEIKNGNYKKGVELCWQWLYYQPFSSASAITGSFASSIGLLDHHEAIKFGERGLISSPNNFLLLNNLAFAHASLNNKDEAKAALSKIKYEDLSSDNKAIRLATLGIINFRDGYIEEGRRNYNEAIAYFNQRGLQKSKGNAMLNLAKEEFLSNTEESDLSFKKAIEWLNKIKDKDLSTFLGNLIKNNRVPAK